MSSAAAINAFEILMMGYLAIGLLYSIFFFTKGIRRMDSASQTGSVGFRVVIWSGVVVLWPILARLGGPADESGLGKSMSQLRKSQALMWITALMGAGLIVFVAVSARTNRVDPAPPKVLWGK